MGQKAKVAYLTDQNQHDPIQMTLLIKTPYYVVNFLIVTSLA